MFRPFALRTVAQVRPTIPFRTYRPLLRPFLRHESNITVQRVRFQQPIFTWRRVATATLYTAAAVFWFDYVIGFAELGEEDEEEYDEEEYEDEDEDTEPLFIPLWFAKPKPRRFYRGSDPEWQEFLKLAPDRERHSKMRVMLVSAIRTAVGREPKLSRHLGKLDPKAGAYWLDITFPDGPPVEYDRLGLELRDEGLVLTRRTVDPQNQARLERALMPTAVFNSLYASARYLFHLEWHKVKAYFGYAPSLEEESKKLQRHIEIMQRMSLVGLRPGGSQNDAASPSQRISPPAPPPVPPSSSGGSSGSGSPAGPKEKGVLPLPDIAPIAPESIAIAIFRSTLSQDWNRQLRAQPPPRGSVIVSGLVEVKGTKGTCTVDVTAAYDPKENKYVLILARLRRLQQRKQVPKGGR